MASPPHTVQIARSFTTSSANAISEGTIPKGNYGAGKVEIFDKGNYIVVDDKEKPLNERQALKNLKGGELKLVLKGKKIKGNYVLVRFKKEDKNWLLIREKEKKKSIQGLPQTNPDKKLEKFVRPMLAHTGTPFDDPDWIYEIKWDGYRAIAEKNEQIKLYSRNGISFIEKFAPIVTELKKLKHDCILDGEIVTLTPKGIPDFQELQNYDPSHAKVNLVYEVFDLLELDHQSTTELSLLQRKELLQKLLRNNKVLKYSDHVKEKGIDFFNIAKKKGLEGIIAKEISDTYHEGIRTKSWLKLKNKNTEDVMVLGYTAPKKERRYFGSLLLGKKENKGWKFCGHVGTGFDNEALKNIYELLQPIRTDSNPFKKKIPVNDTPTWVKPGFVIEISFTEESRDGIYRHPSFIKLRDDKMKTLLDKKPTVTNTDKIFWPKEGYTKGDLINYYKTIAPFILPHLKDRPLSLKRNPNGIKDDGFYHKDAGENAPSFVKVYPYDNGEKVIDYIVCNNEATLIYLANLGCIEMNPWNDRYQQINKPDWLAIDLDPGKHNSFKQVIETAQVAKTIMDKGKLKGYCKTSGASGLHIYIPLHAAYDYDTVKQFAQFLMQQIQEQLPDSTTLERTISKRGKKIYLDYLQNRPGQTLASVYSVRPVAGATVATPIEWKELTNSLDPAEFTMKNIHKRVLKKGDLFKKVLTEKNNLRKALQLLTS